MAGSTMPPVEGFIHDFDYIFISFGLKILIIGALVVSCLGTDRCLKLLFLFLHLSHISPFL